VFCFYYTADGFNNQGFKVIHDVSFRDFAHTPSLRFGHSDASRLRTLDARALAVYFMLIHLLTPSFRFSHSDASRLRTLDAKMKLASLKQSFSLYRAIFERHVHPHETASFWSKR